MRKADTIVRSVERLAVAELVDKEWGWELWLCSPSGGQVYCTVAFPPGEIGKLYGRSDLADCKLTIHVPYEEQESIAADSGE